MEPKSIFFTGAASGIGRATAELFHRKGWFVGCFDVDNDALQDLGKALGDRCYTAYLDVREKAAFDTALALFAEQTDGRLDLMFNNAGITVGGYFDEMPFDKIMDIVNINLIGVLNGTYAAIPFLKQTENSLCFTTSSSAAIFGAPGMAVYGATFAKTPKRNANRTDTSRTIVPSEVADAVWRAYHGTKLHWYVPPELEKNETINFEANRDGQIERNRR